MSRSGDFGHKLALVVVGIGGALFGSFGADSLALGDDSKSYGASGLCAVQYGNIVPYPWGMNNAHPSDLEGAVVCGVGRDTIENDDGLVSAHIRVTDNTSADGFFCGVYAYDTYDTLIDSGTVSTTNGFTGQSSLATYSVDNSDDYGYYSVFCTIPGDSVLHSYRIVEHDPT